ncbi:hypothetical protein ACFCZ3_19710 [Cellulosimicrobium cellulans]|uniref:5' nucleotidase, NT5C type n=1 Tax=Cellulosimicrobium cellulans TaxID=1710 RepID=UPI0035E3A7FE
MRKLRVGFDLDEVMYPFVASLRWYRHHHQGHALDTMPDPAEYEFGPSWGIATREEFVNLCATAVDDGVVFRHGVPFPMAREVTHMLRGAGHEVHIVTARFLGSPGKAEEATRWWLDEHGIAYDSLTFSHDKTVVPTDVYIDDRPDNYDALKAAGVHAVLMDTTHNQDPSCTRTRVRSLEQYAGIVDELARTRKGLVAL